MKPCRKIRDRSLPAVTGSQDEPTALSEPEGLYTHETLMNSFGDGSLTNAGYSFQDRQPLASFEAPDGTVWQGVGYISLDRLPVVQWRSRKADATAWSLWARIGQNPNVFPAPGSNWHGYMSVGIDTAGHVHMIYDGRNSTFRYYRSDTPIHQGWTGGLINRSETGIPGWHAGTASTYWRFSKHPETGLMTLSLRRSGAGHSLFVLDADSQIWSAFPGTRQSDGRLFTDPGIFAQYVSHDIVFRGDDVFVGYSERQSGDATTNENLSVIQYNAASEQWQRLDGTQLTVPVTPETGTVIDPSKTGSMLDHRWDMMVDRHGFVHGFYRRLDAKNVLQIFHFRIDHENTVHGPHPVTDFPDYKEFWQDVRSGGVQLSRARSFYVDDTIYLAWQEKNHGHRTRAMATRYPFTHWSTPQEIDNTILYTSDPEFERWAWDSRGELWLTTLPFTPNTPAGHPVQVVHIAPHVLPVPPPNLPVAIRFLPKASAGVGHGFRPDTRRTSRNSRAT